MSMPDDKEVNQSHKLKDADDNNGIVADDALQKANPAAAAERATDDHDPHNIAKNNKQYDSPLMKDDK